MVARKRKETESYEEYKENLKEEEDLLKSYLSGRMWWSSRFFGQYAKEDCINGKYGKFRKQREKS